MKCLSIIGSSGSIGQQVKRIAMRYPDMFRVVAICVDTDIDSIYEDVIRFHPLYVGVSNEKAARNLDIKKLGGATLFSGDSATVSAATVAESDIVVVSVVGMVGLRAVTEAIRAGKNIALANKESLVTGGEIIMRLAKEKGITLNPIDSEHGAVWQCLHAGKRCDLSRLILTASGGPFRGKTRAELVNVTKEEALNHPTWKMGEKITVDSATLMNKGLEIIEARWLFDTVSIDVIVQPTSVIHSMAEFVDGSVIAQMSYPTMEIPIQLALTYPDRLETEVPKINFETLGNIPFEKADEETFGCLRLAREAMKEGGFAPTVMNAADEEAVKLFLEGQIPFLGIERIIRDTMAMSRYNGEMSIDAIYEVDREVKSRIRKAHTFSSK